LHPEFKIRRIAVKTFPAVALTIASLALLTACGQKGGGGNAAAPGTAQSGGAAASGPDVEIKMSDLPHPRAGLWKIVTDDGDGKPATMSICRSGKMPEMPKMPAGCSKFVIKKTFLGAYVVDMDCKTPNFSMTAHSTVTGDFQTHAAGDSDMTMQIKGQPAKTMKMHMEETWSGPCAPGQTPDQVGG
jgi:hypothetical protein